MDLSFYELRSERFHLWEVYRHHNDWQRMERLLPQMQEGSIPEFMVADAMYALAYRC